MALPRLSPTPGGPTDGVRTTSDPPPVEGPGGRLSPGPGGGDGGDGDDEEEEEEDEPREVPIPVPSDVSEEEVEDAASAAEEALPDDARAVVGESQDTQADERGADEMQRTIEQLRASGDPNQVERTPVLESGNIDVAPDEWELGFPLQGIPRLAAVVNLNYVYNEERERWERQGPFENTATGPTVAKIAEAGPTTVGSLIREEVSFARTVINKGMTVSAAKDQIVVPSDGVYHVEAGLLLDNYEDDAKVEFAATTPLNDGVVSLDALNLDSNNTDETTVGVSGIIQASEGEAIEAALFNSSNTSLEIDGNRFESYLAVQQL